MDFFYVGKTKKMDPHNGVKRKKKKNVFKSDLKTEA